jgi:hypothetical protein
MVDPFTFGLAVLLCLSASIYVRSKRRRARLREFDGGWEVENGPRITRVMSPYIQNVKGE